MVRNINSRRRGLPCAISAAKTHAMPCNLVYWACPFSLGRRFCIKYAFSHLTSSMCDVLIYDCC